MEQRQTQIQEGAGLTESRLNRDFIDFLKRWGGTILLVIVAIAAGYMGLKKWSQYREQRMAAAFEDLEAALASRNPVSLIRVAEDHAGKAAVPIIARLAAADEYLVSVYRGVAPGGLIENDGTVKDAKDLVTPEQRDRLLAQAAEQYQLALTEAGDSRAMALHVIGARFGLAAVAETRGNTEEARKQYDSIIAVAGPAGFGALGDEARRRLDTLANLPKPPKLLAQSDVRTGAPAQAPGGNLPGQVPPEVLRQMQGGTPAPQPAFPVIPDLTLPPLLPPEEAAPPAAKPPVPAPAKP